MKVAFFSAKSYEIQAFQRATVQTSQLEITFLEPRLDDTTAVLAADHEAVCVFVNDQVDSTVLEEFGKIGVKFVALRCAGFNNVDLDAAKRVGIKVVRVPAYSPEAVAEFAVGLILTSVRKYHKAYARVRDGNFTLSGLEGYNLQSKTVGLIGTGRIGLCTGRILSLGFQSKVIAYDPYPNVETARQNGITYVDTLDELLTRADIISLHCPLSDQTKYIINAHTIAKMKKGAVLINTSRGGLIDTKALINALKKDKFLAVAVDVYEGEEGYFYKDSSDKVIQDDLLSRLMSFHNVIITGHQAFLTHEALDSIAETTLHNLQTLKSGAKCTNAVSN